MEFLAECNNWQKKKKERKTASCITQKDQFSGDLGSKRGEKGVGQAPLSLHSLYLFTHSTQFKNKTKQINGVGVGSPLAYILLL